MSPAVRAVRDQWYERLAREGFRDVEMRRTRAGRWYETPATTLGHHEVALSEATTEVTGALWDLPVARHFREVDAAIAILPRMKARTCRKLLRLYSRTGNLLGAARTLGLTRQQARTLLKQALRYARHAGGDDDGEASDPRR